MNSTDARPSLGKLIGSLPVERFLAEYFERRSFLVRSERNPFLRSHSRTLFSFDDVDQILSVPGPRFQDFIRMSKGGHPISRGEYSAVRRDGLVDFNVEQVLGLYADGATITLNRAHQCVPDLSSLCVELSEEFRAHVSANVYITPPNSQGFSVHSDMHDVFLLQTEGRKKWKIQESLEYLATPRNPNVTSDPVSIGAWDEFHLDAGDALYIPRGLLHEGISDGSHSLHITLGIHPCTWGDVVRDALAEAESTDTLLRKSVGGSPDSFEDGLRSLAAQLADADAMRSHASARTGPYRAASHRGEFRKLTEQASVTLETKVRTRSGAEVGLERNCDEIVLNFGTKSIAFPLYVSAHLEVLLDSAGITAEGLPSTLDDDGKITLLRRLLSEGIIEPAA